MDFGTLELHFYGQCGMLLCAVKCADFPNSYIKLKMKHCKYYLQIQFIRKASL